MKRRTIIIVSFVVVNLLVLVGVSHWRSQKQKQFAGELRDAQRYAGATGPTITAFDNRTNRWIAEMKEETLNVTLLKLTDYAEYLRVGKDSTMGYCFDTEKRREQTIYSKDIEDILSNRRFRKAFEDIKKTDRKKATELLTKNIRENLAGLRIHLQGHKDSVSSGKYVSSSGIMGIPDKDSYRHTYYHPDRPPSHFGRRYAVLSYLLLASHFELQEVRPAVEEAVQFAKEEFELFNSMNVVLVKEEMDVQAFLFKTLILQMSIYRPSLLMTATLCDPTWNVEKRKALEAKLTVREIVDWESRALEYDHDAVLGLIPVVPHEGMLKIRYYEGITEAEFDDFFGK